jgi:hypothetical protein
MTTSRIAAAVAAAALTIGLLAGSAGTIIARDATTADAVDCSAIMSQMQSMMSSSGSMMGGSPGMMNGSPGMMNGSSGMMDSQDGTTPEASSIPGGMMGHHTTTSPAPTR